MSDMSGGPFIGARPYAASDRHADWLPLETMFPELAEPLPLYADPEIEPYPAPLRALILLAAICVSWAIPIGLISLI